MLRIGEHLLVNVKVSFEELEKNGKLTVLEWACGKYRQVLSAAPCKDNMCAVVFFDTEQARNHFQWTVLNEVVCELVVWILQAACTCA